MKNLLHCTTVITGLVTIFLIVGVFGSVAPEQLSQKFMVLEDVRKKVAEQLGIDISSYLNYTNRAKIKVDSHEQYGASLARDFDEIFLVVWELNSGKIVYTTRGRNRLPMAFTWAGQKLVYVAYDGIKFAYELDLPITKPYEGKIFMFDPITQQDSTLKIPSGTMDMEVIYSCGDDTIILSYPLPPDYITTRMVWYSISKQEKIQEWVVNVGTYTYFGRNWDDARLIYCTPDHKRIWVVTEIDGPKLPFTGYAPAPVPVLAIVNEKGTKILMNPEKEWLDQWVGRYVDVVRLLKKDEEVFAAITVKWTGRWEDLRFDLVHFSPTKEIWRKRIDIQKVRSKGFKDFEFIWISQDGQKVLCQEYKKGERILFWLDVVSHRVEVITKGKEFVSPCAGVDKVWIKELPDGGLFKVE